MIRDITIGQYYPADSQLHKLDPRVKLSGALIYIISVFIFDNWLSLVLITAFLAAMIVLSKVPFKFMVKGLKPVAFIILFTAVLNLLFTSGDTVLVSFWRISITLEGLLIAGKMLIRISYVVIGASLMTLTTSPTRLTDGMEKGLRFLKYIKVPVHEIAMMMSIALRFIPILIEELDKIMKAQIARGANLDEGNIIKKAKAMVPILVPLFISAWRRASDLANAMDARCYMGGDGRTKLKPLKYGKNDAIAYIILFAYLAAVIASRILL